jgi:uncharacterized protein
LGRGAYHWCVREEFALLELRVTPRAGRDEVKAAEDGTLRVRLRAPPVEGRANEALLRLLARALGVPPSRLSIVSGTTGRIKRLRVEGLSAGEVRRRLGG